jgi:glycosyltransferase involved in cell wall biosynthesis
VKTISIMSPCYNEQENIQELYERVRAVMSTLGYAYEHIFIDNASRDNTVAVLKRIARADRNVKIIINTRNFGHLRSPHHALLQARGDCVIGMSADLQDPPEMIADMVREWEKGAAYVIAMKTTSEENGLMFWIRTKYYRLVKRIASIDTYENFTGFGLYDRQVVEMIRDMKDPYPYFRGMIAEIGLPHVELPFHQPMRKRGLTKNNLLTLYDLAMLGITSHSKAPLRLATFSGFFSAALCVLAGLGYLVYKLVFWNRFSTGIAPLVIGIFFFASVQLIFLGIMGEYVGAIHTFVQNRPLVFERERVNFEHAPGEPLSSQGGVTAGVVTTGVSTGGVSKDGIATLAAKVGAESR